MGSQPRSDTEGAGRGPWEVTLPDDSRPSALDRLELFIGTWSIDARFPNQPELEVDATGAFVTWEWALDRQYLLQRSDAPDPIPSSLSIVGVDRNHDTFTQHYFDSRGVTRLYTMTFDGTEWTLTREQADFSPLDFSQRFVGTFSDDGSIIRGAWEMSHDTKTWELDLELDYTRTG
jgi:hypothetical protein